MIHISKVDFVSNISVLLRWLGKDMEKKFVFIFPTFHFPDFFQLFLFVFVLFFVFPTFHFRFPEFSLPFSRLFTSGSKKLGKRK